MTNADMIRHMSDDKLEEFIYGISRSCKSDSYACESGMCPIFDACGSRGVARAWLSKEADKKESLLDFIAKEEFTAVTEPCSSLLAPEHVDVVKTDTLREFIEKLFNTETE